MEENGWNFYMMPPKHQNCTSSEVDMELVSSIKAFNTCEKVAKVFSDCRKKPSGKFVHPEACLTHAEALQSCYNEVKTVPSQCSVQYNNILTCLLNKGKCEANMNDYIHCEHPALKKYNDYH